MTINLDFMVYSFKNVTLNSVLSSVLLVRTPAKSANKSIIPSPAGTCGHRCNTITQLKRKNKQDKQYIYVNFYDAENSSFKIIFSIIQYIICPFLNELSKTKQDVETEAV